MVIYRDLQGFTGNIMGIQGISCEVNKNWVFGSNLWKTLSFSSGFPLNPSKCL